MKHTHRWLAGMALAAALAGLPGAGPAAAQSLPQPAPALATDRRLDQPRTDGEYLIFLASRADDFSQTRLRGMRLPDGPEFDIAGPSAGGSPYGAVISNGIAVWSQQPCANCPADILAKDLATGREMIVANSPNDEGAPSVSGSWVAWREQDAETVSIKVRPLTSPEAPTTVVSAPQAAGIEAPVIAGLHVYWAEGRYEYGQPLKWSLRHKLLGSDRIDTVGAGEGAPQYDAVADLVVFGGYGRPITVRDMATDYARQIAETGISPTTDGRYVFWSQVREAGPEHSELAIDGFDFHTMSTFQAAAPADTQVNMNPHARAGRLVWQRIVGDNHNELFARDAAAALPSARRPAPAQPTGNPQGAAYFPESGHFLAAPVFKRFWEGSGGLPVFGFPQTEAFRQYNYDLNADFATQYFERQRFEHHPENAGTPYEVLLGRLGVEILQRRGLDWRTFPKADPAAAHYYPQTGQAIAPEFWDYWRSHGLEFGAPGVSEAEALALFGYPISPARLETNSSGDRVLTQWFERARFEYHPANPAPFKVLLGRLAAEALAIQGW